MRCAFLCYEFLLGGRKKASTVASHILIRSVSRVYENAYLLMCLFLLAVEIPLETKPLWPFRVSWQGLIRILCALFFHSVFDRIFFRLMLFQVADGELLFHVPLLMLVFKVVVMCCPHPCLRRCPGLMPSCHITGSRRCSGCSQFGGSHEPFSTFSSEQANWPIF